MNALRLLKDDEFRLRLRMRVEDAARTNRDVAGAAIDAIREHVEKTEPTVLQILHRTRRVHVVRGAENTYVIDVCAADDERDVRQIILTQPQFHREPHVFLEKWLAEFHENLQLAGKEWPSITNEWLQPPLLDIGNGHEVVTEELSAIENFRDHILVNWQPTKSVREAVEQDRVLLEVEGTVLIRGERIERWLSGRGYRIKLNEFAKELKRAGLMVEANVQKKVGDEGTDARRVLRFWRFNNVWGFSEPAVVPLAGLNEDDIVTPPPMPTTTHEAEDPLR